MPFVNGRWPEIDTPVPCPVPVAVDVVAPGEIVASALKSRVTVGRSSICLLVMTVASVLCVSTATLRAIDVDLSPTTPPSFMVKLDGQVLSDAQLELLLGRRRSRRARRSPRTGRAAGSAGSTVPPRRVTVVCAVLVSTWRTVTVTPGSAPPC